jgi:hypothetical protein
MDQKRRYAAAFLTESLGFAVGDVDAGSVPSQLVESIVGAVGGNAGATSELPALEHEIRDYGKELADSLLETRGFVLQKERWPGGARYSCCLTHDVDNLSRPLSHILARRQRFSTADILLAILRLRNLYDNISLVSRSEADRGLRSSFYLLSSNYDLRKKSRQLNRLQNEGWDVGLHGDFGTHDSREKMSEALSRFKVAIGINPIGVREHFLKFDFDQTWAIMDEAGFMYDSSVGNTDRLGFRLGLCTPFHPPDQDWNPRRILELPLSLMDTTLWGYMKANEEEGMKAVGKLKEAVADVNGLLTILWHTEAARMKGGRLYPAVLDSLPKDGCFIASGREIARWWTSRASPLILSERTYRIEDAPKGLTLRFKAKGGERLVAEGGMTSENQGVTTVSALGGPVSLEVR